MREGSLLPDRVGTKSVNKRAAARRGGPEMASGEAADSRAKVSSLFRFRVFPQSPKHQMQNHQVLTLQTSLFFVELSG